MESVANQLIGLRLKDARKRHDLVLFTKLIDGASAPEDLPTMGAAEYLPPRRQWLRPPREKRVGCRADKVARHAIWRTINAHQRRKTLANTPWGAKLLAFTDEIRAVACGEFPGEFKHPDIVVIPKATRGKFRVMAPCKTLKDRVVSGLLARYFEELIEPLLGPACYSFRVGGRTYHDAILDLAAYRKKMGKRKLYVTECDLRGFYDSLAHNVALRSISDAASERGWALDPHAERLLKDLLASYSFPAYGQPEAIKKIATFKSPGDLGWLSGSEIESVYGSTPMEAIGVAQGNPVSPVLANAVLRKADAKMKEMLGESGFYARYCDDIIMLHPNRAICTKALNEYVRMMKALMLPVHKPEDVGLYGKVHYQIKSRKPYRWDERTVDATAIPWIQFVGYQMNRAGELRIRKDSIEKQKDSISELVNRTTHLIKHAQKDSKKLKKPGSSIYNSIAMRIIRAGTGDRRPGREQLAGEPCWVDAYPLLEDNSHVRSQMRKLDRHREARLHFFRSWLKKQGLIDDDSTPALSDKEPSKKRRSFWGAPYSYFASVGKTKPRFERGGGGYSQAAPIMTLPRLAEYQKVFKRDSVDLHPEDA